MISPETPTKKIVRKNWAETLDRNALLGASGLDDESLERLKRIFSDRKLFKELEAEDLSSEVVDLQFAEFDEECL